MAYDLEQLGSAGFQDLAAALLLDGFGPGVQVMGSGRDGGRDLYYKGQLIWKATEEQASEVWEGYTVFQVKHKETLKSQHAANAAWLWSQVREELDTWADPSSGRNPVPDFLVFISNVPLTPVPNSGGHDFIDANIRQYVASLEDDSRDVGTGAERRARLQRMKRLRKWRVWDGNQIQALLNASGAVRRAFPGFLTAADVFGNLSQITGFVSPENLEAALRAHARTTLVGEGMIYFDEAGAGDTSGLPVHQVAIDLPVTLGHGGGSGSVIQHVLDHGERLLRPKLTTVQVPRHLIVAGAPGNGKTTISKFLVQAYRAALLSGAEDLSSHHRALILGMRQALGRFGRAMPRHRRWPMRIDLAEYARDHGQSIDSTLIRYIAERISLRSDVGKVQPNNLLAWMRRWPWFLILDGLDEVTDPIVRKRLIERVTELVTNADADDCDLCVVLTTRPMGFTEAITPAHFRRIDLDYLQPDEAVRYGTLVTKIRLRNDLDRMDKVTRQLQSAATDEALQNLLRTPLQVLIMTIIIGASGNLAPDRFSLFWGYYETIFRRERDKQTGFSRILQEHGQQIQQLHERIGFELQARSEVGSRSDAALTDQELRNITWDVLHHAGFKPSGADADLLTKIVNAATRRLVLIAPRGDEGYGFDVRSLQELMAAMYVTTGPLDVVMRRLRVAAASPHWRNTWIFAAGHLFSVPQEHQQQALIELVETIDERAHERLGGIVPIGPRLALDVIDDGMARSLPKWRDRLIVHGLRTLWTPPSTDLLDTAHILARFADTGEPQRHTIAESLRDALAGPTVARLTASLIQRELKQYKTSSSPWLAKVRKREGTSLAPEAPDGWADFTEEIATYPLTEEAHGKVGDAVTAMNVILRHNERQRAKRRRSRSKGSLVPTEHEVSAILTGLADGQGAAALASALHHVAAHEPVLVQALQQEILPLVHRAAIGEHLR
jgi:chorismate mutase